MQKIDAVGWVKGLLKSYPSDRLLSEFYQNAEDAGTISCRFLRFLKLRSDEAKIFAPLRLLWD